MVLFLFRNKENKILFGPLPKNTKKAQGYEWSRYGYTHMYLLIPVSDQLTQIQKEKQSMQEDLLYMQSQNMRNNLIFAKNS